MTNTNRPIRRALVSVFHKEGIEVLAEAFVKAGTEVVSTGSTAKKLAELGVKVTEVSDVTGFPECLDGRVKTLHPYIHAGILADMTNPEHAKQLEEFGIKPFDLVVVNLYPFADTVRSGANEADTIEKIDIGGPSMVRGAAKNHATVAIVTDPADYALVASRVADGTGFSLDERKWLGMAPPWPGAIGLQPRPSRTPPPMTPPSTSGPPSTGPSRPLWTPSRWTRTIRALKSIPPSSRPSSPAPGIVRTPCATVRTPTSRPPSTLTRSTRPVSPTPSSSAASR